MDNPGTLAAFDTQDTGRKQTNIVYLHVVYYGNLPQKYAFSLSNDYIYTKLLPIAQQHMSLMCGVYTLIK